MSTEAVLRAAWTSWDGTSTEELILRTQRDGADAESKVRGPDGFHYRVHADPAWRTRRVEVSTDAGARLRLASDGEGSWSQDARPRGDLAGCLDVDISGTPFTNTLPIRRLVLPIGGSATIEVAYIEIPSLAVRRERQRYTRMGGRRYRFEGDDGRFVRDIDVDAEGLVTVYPGLFHRTA